MASKSKKLVFVPRYGWVIDGRREPIDEALSGGRGTFCIVPLAKGLYSMVSRSVSASSSAITSYSKCSAIDQHSLFIPLPSTANTTVELLDNPDSLSLPHLQAKMQDQFVKIPDWKSLMLKGQSLSLPAIGPWHFHTESGDPHGPGAAQL